MRQSAWSLLAVVLVAGAMSADRALAQDAEPPRLRVDLGLYPLQRTVKDDVDSTTTINARLSSRLTYFGYVNMRGTVTDGPAVFARSEQNLRYSVSDTLPVDLSFQGVLVRGDGNDFYQLGLSWRVHATAGLEQFFDRMNLIYRMTFQLKRFEFEDDSSWQIEHFFRANLSERFYLSGFVDQTFDLDAAGAPSRSPVVAEVQLGMRLFDNFYAITEYRSNDFRVGNESNLAAGIEYKFRW